MTRIGLLSDTHAFWDDKYLKYFENCDEIRTIRFPPLPAEHPESASAVIPAAARKTAFFMIPFIKISLSSLYWILFSSQIVYLSYLPTAAFPASIFLKLMH